MNNSRCSGQSKTLRHKRILKSTSASSPKSPPQEMDGERREAACRPRSPQIILIGQSEEETVQSGSNNTTSISVEISDRSMSDIGVAARYSVLEELTGQVARDYYCNLPAALRQCLLLFRFAYQLQDHPAECCFYVPMKSAFHESMSSTSCSLVE